MTFYNGTLTTISKVLLSISPTANQEEKELVKVFRKLDWRERQRLYKLIEEAANHGQ